ncbi:MAG: hypothetical protein GC154_06890 [bacterium]|nr:hypothetical protein [bacterium]
MKRTLLPVVMLVCITFNGCFVPFLNPLWTEDTLQFKPSLLGDWQDDDSHVFRFSRNGDSKLYNLEYMEDGKTLAVLEAGLVELGGEPFLNTKVKDLPLQGDFPKMHLLPIRHIFKIELNGELKLIPFNVDWMKDQLANENGLAHVVSEDDMILITARTAELQVFVTQHAKDRDAFDDPLTLKKTQ